MINENYFEIALSSPWKVYYELVNRIVTPFQTVVLKLVGVKIGINPKFYGFIKVFKTRKSKIVIGNNFESRNLVNSNPLGVNHPAILCTWKPDAELLIGNDVGMSGGSIVATTSIKIGNGTLIGANCLIIDSDFHPIASINRRYDKSNVRTKPVIIGNNVFIGTGSIILKGSVIPDDSIIPAGSVVRSNTKL
jgi:acetyltransferase-like isoleucine patch superfamily enzyme